MKKTLSNIFLLLLIHVSVSCSIGMQWKPIENPDKLYEFEGFHYLPPQGAEWGTANDSPSIFLRKTEEKFHTVYVSVVPEYFSDSEVEKGPKAFLEEIAQRSIEMQLEEEKQKNRFRLIEAQKKIVNSHQTLCIQLDTQFEDHAVPGQKDKVFLLKGHSLACIHPELANLVVTMEYSERLAMGSSLPGFQKEAKRFFESFSFQPIDFKISSIQVGSSPKIVAVGDGDLWISNHGSNTVSRIDPKTSEVTATIKVGGKPYGISTAKGAVWVNNSMDGTVYRIDPNTNQIVGKVHVGGRPLQSVMVGDELWVLDGARDNFTVIDTTSNEIITKKSITQGEFKIIYHGIGVVDSEVWIGNFTSMGGAITVYNATTHDRDDTIMFLQGGPMGMLVVEDSVWVVSHYGNVLYRFDRKTKDLLAKIEVGKRPADLAYFQDQIWVINPHSNEILRIDPKTNKIVGKPIFMGNFPYSMEVLEGALWISQSRGNAIYKIEPHTK